MTSAPPRAPVGLVLAGGLGLRLGRTKGDLVRGGRPLAVRAADTLAPLCAGVLVSLRPGADNPAPGWPAVEDRPPAGRGPLAGIAAAFAVAPQADLLVLACDYPEVDTALLARILERAAPADEVVLPVDPAGRDHPLCGLWRWAVAAAVERALVAGRFAVRDLLRERRVRRLGPAAFDGIDLSSRLRNVNRPEDL